MDFVDPCVCVCVLSVVSKRYVHERGVRNPRFEWNWQNKCLSFLFGTLYAFCMFACVHMGVWAFSYVCVFSIQWKINHSKRICFCVFLLFLLLFAILLCMLAFLFSHVGRRKYSGWCFLSFLRLNIARAWKKTPNIYGFCSIDPGWKVADSNVHKYSTYTLGFRPANTCVPVNSFHRDAPYHIQE